jgi:hypothetical protein
MPLRQQKEVRVLPNIPDGFPMVFSNYSIVQMTGGEVIISFFQAASPIVDSQEEFDAQEAMPGHCCARMVMSLWSARRLLLGLQDVMEGLEQQMRERAGQQQPGQKDG